MDQAWAHLAEGRWQDARDAFGAAVADRPGAEAFEGMSWAAWWLDDAEAVFECRERAYHLYREAGADESAARMATWIAADQLDFRGAAAVANGWLRRARTLLEPLPPGPDHGWLAFHEGYVASGRGDAAQALVRAEEAAELGRRCDVPDLEMLGLALRGAVLVSCARVSEGMGCLDEATTLALEGTATIPISGAWACCFLVGACESVRDYARAFDWCDRIAEFAERYGSAYMLGFCRTHYAAVHLWRGEWTRAEEALQAAIDHYRRSRPAFTGEALVALAELRRRQGRWDDAERLLEEAGPSAAPLCRAALALDRGDADAAVRLAERRLRSIPEQRRLMRAEALELLVHARSGAGDLVAARASLGELRALADVVDTVPLRAAADLAEGALALAAEEPDRALRRLEDAVDGFERCSAPYDAARARILLSEALARLDHHDAAENEAARAREALDALRAVGDAGRGGGPLAEAGSGGGLDAVTPREREVLTLVAEGLTNREIAGRLVISEHTVHRHVTNILRKLDVPSRAAAAARAARSGLGARGRNTVARAQGARETRNRNDDES